MRINCGMSTEEMFLKIKSQIETGFENHANSLIECGYADATPELVAEFHESWLAGESKPDDRAYTMSVDVFENYPHIFGARSILSHSI